MSNDILLGSLTAHVAYPPFRGDPTHRSQCSVHVRPSFCLSVRTAVGNVVLYQIISCVVFFVPVFRPHYIAPLAAHGRRSIALSVYRPRHRLSMV